MGIGFQPDNSPKTPYNNGKEGRVVVEGFSSDRIEKEHRVKIINDFADFCGTKIRQSDYKNQIFHEAKRIMGEDKIDGKELMVAIENKFANELISYIKSRPEVIFSELLNEKDTINKIFDVGISKENFNNITEPELISLFINQAKIISGNGDKIDMTNPQVVKGIRNIVDLGVKKEHIVEAINH